MFFSWSDPETYAKILLPIGIVLGIRFQYLIYKYVPLLFEKTDYYYKFNKIIPNSTFNEKFGVVGIRPVWKHIRKNNPLTYWAVNIFICVFFLIAIYDL